MTTAAETKNDSVWHDMVTVELGEGQSVSCRYRELLRGVFHENELQLVWKRTGGSTFQFLIADFHAGYKNLIIHRRSDESAIWVTADMGNTRRTIASLDFQTLEFHAEGDFSSWIEPDAWAIVARSGGVFKETQLDRINPDGMGQQYLSDGTRKWVSSDGITWQAIDSTGDVNMPFDALVTPFKMAPPGWATIIDHR